MLEGTARPIAAAVLAAFAMLAAASEANAQDGMHLRTTTRLNLRPTPDTLHTPLRVLSRGAELVVIAPDTAQGFYHVVVLKPARRDTGWVATPYVRPLPTEAMAMAAPEEAPVIEGLDAPAERISADWDKQPIRHSTWKGTDHDTTFSCPYRGLKGNDDPETNERKNRIDVPTRYHAVQFSAIADSATMPWPKGKTRPAWDATAKGRADRASMVTPFEGAAVTVTGFIRVIRPQSGNRESTNCRANGEANTDWHIALVGDFAAPESLAMVVEPTPRMKKLHQGKWTRAKLADYENPGDDADSVRVSGFLMLDPEHMNHMHRYRQTLWEIHPVTRIEVFVKGTGWVELDDR